MNAVSMNNLWTYLQGLSLTADNWQWLAERMTEKSQSLKDNSATVVKKKYRISPRMKQLMGSVSIDPNDVENDDKLKYILNK
jgi:hypothetical protein